MFFVGGEASQPGPPGSAGTLVDESGSASSFVMSLGGKPIATGSVVCPFLVPSEPALSVVCPFVVPSEPGFPGSACSVDGLVGGEPFFKFFINNGDQQHIKSKFKGLSRLKILYYLKLQLKK